MFQLLKIGRYRLQSKIFLLLDYEMKIGCILLLVNLALDEGEGHIMYPTRLLQRKIHCT
jgi:hypothetical protein